MPDAVKFSVNGKNVSSQQSPITRLSDVLRNDLGLTGTKVGCNAGDCGACTVLVADEAVCSCLIPVGRLAGKAVLTVEGLQNHTIGRVLQQSFKSHGAAQCGICSPGMLLAAVALLQTNPHPTTAQVVTALGGVLCRCTGYQKIIAAVVNAFKSKSDDVPVDAESNLGINVPRVDAEIKLNGSEKFGADFNRKQQLMIKAVRSKHAHATFEIGNITEFVDNHAGIDAVFTAADIPGENCFGVIPEYADQPVLAQRVTRFMGEAIAIVVGTAEAIGQLNIDHFPVVWQALEAVDSTQQAMQPGADLLHAKRKHNQLITGLVQRGDVEKGLTNAAVIAQGDFSTGFVEHAYIEPEAGFAERRENTIDIVACTQSAYMNQHAIAKILGIKDQQVRVIPSAVGGGFGSKLDLSFQGFIALAAWLLNAKVGMEYSRTESMATTTKRHPSEITVKIAADEDGKFAAMDFDGKFNTGAYASWGPTVANRVPVHASGPYYFPAYKAESLAVHSHNPPAGAFRGFGVPQSAMALECLIDELADKLNIDQLQFRINNALANGMETVTGQVFFQGVGINDCLQKLEQHWQKKQLACLEFNNKNKASQLRRGVGLAAVWYGCGNTSLPNPSTIKAGINRDGELILHQGAIDIGQGSNTVIAQIFAQALGVSVSTVQLIGPDTLMTPDAGKTSASRQTFVTGNAARLAGEALRKKILTLAHVTDKQASIKFINNQLYIVQNGKTLRVNFSELTCDNLGYVLQVQESYDPPTKPLDKNGQGNPYAQYGYGAQLAEVEVNTVLGTVKVCHIVAAHDVGRAINPQMIEGQIQGGIAQGLGMALMEEYRSGVTNNLHDYLIPTAGDIPPITSIIIEQPDTHGPFGAKGLGEHTLIATAPAIINAIRNACGARVKHLPATPEKVLKAISLAQQKQPS